MRLVLENRPVECFIVRVQILLDYNSLKFLWCVYASFYTPKIRECKKSHFSGGCFLENLNSCGMKKLRNLWYPMQLYIVLCFKRTDKNLPAHLRECNPPIHVVWKVKLRKIVKFHGTETLSKVFNFSSNFRYCRERSLKCCSIWSIVEGERGFSSRCMLPKCVSLAPALKYEVYMFLSIPQRVFGKIFLGITQSTEFAWPDKVFSNIFLP